VAGAALTTSVLLFSVAVSGREKMAGSTKNGRLYRRNRLISLCIWPEIAYPGGGRQPDAGRTP